MAERDKPCIDLQTEQIKDDIANEKHISVRQYYTLHKKQIACSCIINLIHNK